MRQTGAGGGFTSPNRSPVSVFERVREYSVPSAAGAVAANKAGKS